VEARTSLCQGCLARVLVTTRIWGCLGRALFDSLARLLAKSTEPWLSRRALGRHAGPDQRRFGPPQMLSAARFVPL